MALVSLKSASSSTSPRTCDVPTAPMTTTAYICRAAKRTVRTISSGLYTRSSVNVPFAMRIPVQGQLLEQNGAGLLFLLMRDVSRRARGNPLWKPHHMHSKHTLTYGVHAQHSLAQKQAPTLHLFVPRSAAPWCQDETRRRGPTTDIHHSLELNPRRDEHTMNKTNFLETDFLADLRATRTPKAPCTTGLHLPTTSRGIDMAIRGQRRPYSYRYIARAR